MSKTAILIKNEEHTLSRYLITSGHSLWKMSWCFHSLQAKVLWEFAVPTFNRKIGHFCFDHYNAKILCCGCATLRPQVRLAFDLPVSAWCAKLLHLLSGASIFLLWGASTSEMSFYFIHRVPLPGFALPLHATGSMSRCIVMVVQCHDHPMFSKVLW